MIADLRFHQTPHWVQRVFPQMIWRVPTQEKKLYLTFDDGPVPGPTEFVLSTLQSFKITATFFCIGDNVRRHPEIFSRVLAAGHGVGNHTDHHLDGWRTQTDLYLQDLIRCDEAIMQHATMPQFFRPPYGKITWCQAARVKAINKRVVMWDVLPYDFDAALAPEQCLLQTIKATRRGSVVVFHDSLKAERNLTYALPRYIERMLEEQYTFDVLPAP